MRWPWVSRAAYDAAIESRDRWKELAEQNEARLAKLATGLARVSERYNRLFVADLKGTLERLSLH